MPEALAPKLPSGEATSNAPITHWTMRTITTSSSINRTTRQKTFDTTLLLNQWMLTDAAIASPASECRTRAARDALSREKDYATAFGREGVQAYKIVDTDYGLPVMRTVSLMRTKKMAGDLLREN
ncbi:hypothetical protein PAAG_12197 [Paracoccidioides lutzii Pb01]|uniref:Uncharacterized protein n=1 Tax=Paracoccidioides lutzii (strain ATCC MYA-826 / Pb01) TaxID=502779 RepID=A0A0A2V124_PARBA|nr:hypothetical protein PAAG_12197 [Paracoccidioides lutzii Pb01]KGQ01158.1 hypothetical protein PAAG_12197 [Paracoccidioides lutzii Pb01]